MKPNFVKLNYEFPCHFSPGCNFCQNSNMPCLPDGTRMTPVVSQNSVLSPTRSHQLNAGLHNLWQPGSRAAKKWRENEKMKGELEKAEGNGERMRKWREYEEIVKDSLSTFPHFLFISPLPIHFLSKIFRFCRKMLNRTLLSRMSQRTQHTC